MSAIRLIQNQIRFLDRIQALRHGCMQGRQDGSIQAPEGGSILEQLSGGRGLHEQREQ